LHTELHGERFGVDRTSRIRKLLLQIKGEPQVESEVRPKDGAQGR
jgi:hypothetical protein